MPVLHQPSRTLLKLLLAGVVIVCLSIFALGGRSGGSVLGVQDVHSMSEKSPQKLYDSIHSQLDLPKELMQAGGDQKRFFLKLVESVRLANWWGKKTETVENQSSAGSSPIESFINAYYQLDGGSQTGIERGWRDDNVIVHIMKSLVSLYTSQKPISSNFTAQLAFPVIKAQVSSPKIYLVSLSIFTFPHLLT